MHSLKATPLQSKYTYDPVYPPWGTTPTKGGDNCAGRMQFTSLPRDRTLNEWFVYDECHKQKRSTSPN